MKTLLKIFATRERRIIIYLAIGLMIVGFDYAARYWSPALVHETKHYVIYSTATAEQTAEIGQVAEMVYRSYQELLQPAIPTNATHPKLKMKLFKTREEFRRSNRGVGWAEAFYRKPYCYQYYPSGDPNPYQWMTHEATHQLGVEVAGLSLQTWLDEGIAEYISTSRIIGNRFALGEIDTNTYPVYWLSIMATSKNLAKDKENSSFIPLRSIISGKGGPDMDEHFNLYYVHWWSLVHFLFNHQDGKYRAGLMKLIQHSGNLAEFKQFIGNIEVIEQQWFAYVLNLKKSLSGRRTPAVRLSRVENLQN